MRFILLTILLLSLKTYESFGQTDVNSVDTKTQKVLANAFKNKLDSANFLLYSLENRYIVIEKRSKNYELFFIREGSGIDDSISIKKKNKVLKIAFNPESCNESTVSSKSDSIKPHPHSRYIHFFLKEKGVTYCEFTLPALFSSNISEKKVYPLNERVHEFLLKKMFTHWKD